MTQYIAFLNQKGGTEKGTAIVNVDAGIPAPAGSG